MRYVLFFCIYFFTLPFFAQQETKNTEVEKEMNVAPATNSNNVEYPAVEELRKKDKKSSLMYSEEGSKSAESQIIQQRFSNANASFQQSYSSSKKMSSRKSPTGDEQLEMNMRLETMRATNASAFDYQLAEYQIGNHDVSKIDYLKEAERLNPNSKEVQLQLIAYHDIKGDGAKKEYLKKINGSKYFSQDLLNYARFVLTALPENGILITHGVDDTYPIWIQQSLNNFRSDVQIISLDLLQSEEYRNKLKGQGFSLPTSSFIDTKFLQEFIRLNNNKKIHVSMTVPAPYLKSLKSYLEIEGLSFTNKSPDPATTNQHIYQQLLQELENVPTPSTTVGKQLQLNYVPMLLVIRNTAQVTKDERLKQKVDKQLLEISKAAGKETQVKTLMK
jgi:hypothetical protein